MSDQRGATSAATGQKVSGRYLLLQEVGRGGMWVVHRAHDEVLNREVAAKFLHPHLATYPAFLERFRREARAGAGLNHPNIVAVHDWGEHKDGAFYLILQFVDGVSLRDILRVRGRLTPGETLAVLVPAAAGLQAAHDAGLVHRDVKPENLLIGRDGSVRVTDFGLARAAAAATSTFGPEVLVGSPHYLAPEAVQGSPLDGRADVYALGILLFECLTGRPPHSGETPFTTAVAHVERAVPAPSSLGHDLDPALDALVLAATHRDPARRTASAWDFALQLRDAVVDESKLPRVSDVMTAAAPARPPVDPAAPTPPLGTSITPPSPGFTVVVPVADLTAAEPVEHDGEEQDVYAEKAISHESRGRPAEDDLHRPEGQERQGLTGRRSLVGGVTLALISIPAILLLALGAFARPLASGEVARGVTLLVLLVATAWIAPSRARTGATDQSPSDESAPAARRIVTTLASGGMDLLRPPPEICDVSESRAKNIRGDVLRSGGLSLLRGSYPKAGPKSRGG